VAAAAGSHSGESNSRDVAPVPATGTLQLSCLCRDVHECLMSQAREAGKEAKHQLVVAESRMEQERARLEAQLFTAKSKIARLERDKGPQQGAFRVLGF
jgi:hypothetical protein